MNDAIEQCHPREVSVITETCVSTLSTVVGLGTVANGYTVSNVAEELNG